MRVLLVLFDFLSLAFERSLGGEPRYGSDGKSVLMMGFGNDGSVEAILRFWPELGVRG